MVVTDSENGFSETILQLAHQLPADLIVMGTHGRRGLQKLSLGSVTGKVIHRSVVPLLIVPSLNPLIRLVNWPLFFIWKPDNTIVMPVIQLKRAYDKPKRGDGYHILVDRLWPRGLSREEAAIDEWAKDIAPGTSLRTWFDHDPDRWEAFQKKYRAELDRNDAWNEFILRHGSRKKITLVYATKYDKLTHALVIRQALEETYRTV